MTMRFQIEVAVETPEDAATADSGGADRIELSTALDLGGITPTPGLYQEVRAATKLPVLVMLRPRPGDFVYSDAEFRVLLRDAAAYRPLAPAGFVFGALRDDGAVDTDRCLQVLETCGAVPCVFHRAFDRCPDPVAALAELTELGFVRVLTSGRETSALAGSPHIKELRKHAGNRIELLPCGRIRAGNVETVIRVSGCTQVHASFAETIPESPAVGKRGYQRRSRVSLDDLSETRRVLDRLALNLYDD
jgi:copper homeostasis protein